MRMVTTRLSPPNLNPEGLEDGVNNIVREITPKRFADKTSLKIKRSFRVVEE